MRNFVILALLGSGTAVAVAGLWRVFSLPREALEQKDRTVASTALPRVGTWPKVWLFVLLAAALALRLEGLERRGITHVEVYVPGIQLPAGIAEPPPRIGLAETALWHFHGETHPQAYYFFMWGWTRAFGTGLKAIRVPSVLFGVAAVGLLFVLATRLFDPLTGLIAAGMMAFNGYQVYWSQWARMYMPSGFLAIASTLLFVSLLRSRDRSRRREVAYVGVTWLMLFTQVLSWGLLGGQIVASLRLARSASGRLPRIIQLQGLVAILGAPLLAHAIYRAGPIEADPPWRLFRDFFNFGFLFVTDSFSEVPREVPVLLATALATAVVVCLALAGRRPATGGFAQDTPEALAMRPVDVVALGVLMCVLGLAILAWQRQLAVALTALTPILVVGLLYLGDARWCLVARVQDRLSRGSGTSEAFQLMLILAFVPMLLLSTVHLAKPLMTIRGAIVYTPFLLTAIAAGLALAFRRVDSGLVVGGLLLAAHVASVVYHRSIPEPFDYRGITAQLNQEYRDGDLVFVPAHSWATTPLFYGLAAPRRSLVAADYEAALAGSPNARVWVPLINDQPAIEKIARSLASRRMTRELTARRARAQLFVP